MAQVEIQYCQTLWIISKSLRNMVLFETFCQPFCCLEFQVRCSARFSSWNIEQKLKTQNADLIVVDSMGFFAPLIASSRWDIFCWLTQRWPTDRHGARPGQNQLISVMTLEFFKVRLSNNYFLLHFRSLFISKRNCSQPKWRWKMAFTSFRLGS